MTNEPGTIYLLCFAPGLQCRENAYSRHYLGWTSRTPETRLAEHIRGQGCPLVQAAHDRGLEPTIVRTWDGTRNDERALKNRKNLPRLCPNCNQESACTT